MASDPPARTARPRDADAALVQALHGLCDANWDWNLETDEVRYSPAWKRMLGYRDDELAPHLDTWNTLCHPDDRARVMETIESCLAADRDLFEVEFRLRHADGRWRQILSRGILVRDAEGRLATPRRIIGTHLDMSGHAAVEQRLAHSLSLLRATLDSTADGLLVADGQGRMETFNRRFAELWRLPPEMMASGDDNAALAFVLDQLVDPDDFLAKVSDIYAHPEGESFDILRFRDGRVFERYSRPQWVDDAAVGRVWSFRDVTERERAMAGLADQMRRSLVLFEQSRDGIVVIDMGGNVHECNGRFAEMLGRTVDEVRAMKVWEWDATMPAEVIRERFLSRPLPPHAFRTRHRRKDGTVLDVEISSGSLVWQGQPQYLCTVRDITDSIRADEEHQQLREQLLQAQKMDAIGQLTGGIAHEFNNMLGVVLGYASLAGELAANHDDRQLGEYLASIRRAGENARDLVAKLLAFGKRRPVTQRTPQDPAQLVQAALQLLRPALPTSLRLDSDLPDNLPAVIVEGMEFQQVIANLLLNASQATGQRGLVTLRARNWDGEATCAGCHLAFSGRFVALTVADDGPGMTAEVRARIFEPFFTTKAAGHGTGLGLPVVHGIVHAAGGHLLVESSPGSGSAFTILLPTGSAPAATEAPESPPHALKPETGRSIMVVDDQAEMAELLANMLASRGHRPRQFTDGGTALAAFGQDPDAYELVISDQTMPGLSGVELLRAIRRLRPGLPLVIWSGCGEAVDETTLAEIGISGYVRKPVTIEELTELLRRLF